MKKKLRGIAAFVLTSLIFSSFAALAAPVAINEVKVAGESVTVSGTAEKPDTYVSMVVVKKGGSTENTEDILTVGQTKTDSAGKYSLYFEIPASYAGKNADGEYDVIVHLNHAQSTSGSFLYVGTATRNEFLAIVKTKTAQEVVDAIVNQEEYRKGFDIDGANVEDFMALTQNQKYALMEELFTDYDRSALTLTGFAVDFNRMTAFYSIENKSNVATNLTLIDPQFKEKKFTENSDIEKEDIQKALENLIPFGSYSKFGEGYAIAAILTIVNHARYSALDELMNQYKTELGLSGNDTYIKYVNLTSIQKQAVCETIVETLKNNKAYTVSAYKKTLSDAIGALPTGGGSKGSGRGDTSTGTSKNTYIDYTAPNGVTAVEAVLKDKDSEIEFDDLDNVTWAKKEILELAKKGIISGVGGRQFAPDRVITREEFIKIIVDAAGVHDKNAVCDFEDVEKGSWYASYVASAVQNGLISGQSETLFGTGSAITRQDVCTIAAKLLPADTEVTALSFTDSEEIAAYAREGVAKLAGLGIVSGMGNHEFKPADTCTRAQAAKIVAGILKGE